MQLISSQCLLVQDGLLPATDLPIRTSLAKSYYGTLVIFLNDVIFNLSKGDLIKSNNQQSDGSLTFYCKILTHVKQNSDPSADPSSLAIDCSSGLSSHLDGLFNNMQFSDVNFNIGGREFLAHKNILAARSQYFAAMFQHPMKEQSTNQVKIEDIEPGVFDQLLRFIYTGRVPLDKLETMAADLFIAADKYLMDELKMKCENYLLSQMSPDNCVILTRRFAEPKRAFEESGQVLPA